MAGNHSVYFKGYTPKQSAPHVVKTELSLILSDVTLRATAAGAGPVVLLLHAGGECRSVWAPVAAHLARHGLRAVAYDLRGHGDSSGVATTVWAVARDVAEMVRREAGPVVIVGASLGGLAAMTALAEPAIAQRVTGLVLVDVVPDADPERVRQWMHDHGLDDRFAGLVADVLESGPSRLAAVASLDMPIVLVRAGRESPLADADVNRLLVANRRVTVRWAPAAGHLVARDDPIALARA